MTAKARFTQSDVTRAAKGLRAAGERGYRIEILPDGRLVMLTGDNAAIPAKNSFDEIINR